MYAVEGSLTSAKFCGQGGLIFSDSMQTSLMDESLGYFKITTLLSLN